VDALGDTSVAPLLVFEKTGKQVKPVAERNRDALDLLDGFVETLSIEEGFELLEDIRNWHFRVKDQLSTRRDQEGQEELSSETTSQLVETQGS